MITTGSTLYDSYVLITSYKLYRSITNLCIVLLGANWLLCFMFFIFFQTLNYAELSKGSSESGDSTPYYMTHGTGSDTVQFGICEEGPFGPVNIFSSPLECSE